MAPIIQYPGVQKDVFGGPARSTPRAMWGLADAIVNFKKIQNEKEQAQVISDLLSAKEFDGLPYNNPGVGGVSGFSDESISQLRGERDLTAEELVQRIMGNDKLDMPHKMLATQLVEQREKMQEYGKAERGKLVDLTYWGPDGKKHINKVDEGKFNTIVAQLEEAGYTVAEPEKPSYSVIDYWDKSGIKKSVRVSNDQYNNVVDKLIAGGSRIEKPEDPDSEPGPYSATGKLLADRNRLSPDDPDRKHYDAALQAAAAKEGFILETNPDGSMRLVQGNVEGSLSPTRVTQNEAQKNIMSLDDELVRLQSVLNDYDSKYLTVAGKAEASLLNLQDKLKGLGADDLGEGERQYLEDFSEFTQNSVENINLYIKRITGAQMSEKEAERIRKAMPDPGDNWVEGDGPTRFKSKLENAIRKVRAARARYAIYLQQGLSEDNIKNMVNGDAAMGLDEVQKRISERGNAIEIKLKSQNPDLGGTKLQRAVLNQLSDEFGIKF